MNFIKKIIIFISLILLVSCVSAGNTVKVNEEDDKILTMFDAKYDVFTSYDILKQHNYILTSALLEGYGYKSLISIKYTKNPVIYNIMNNTEIRNADELFIALIKSGQFVSGEKMLNLENLSLLDTEDSKIEEFIANLILLSQKGYFAVLYIKDAFGTNSQIAILKRQFSYDNGLNKTELPLYSVFPKPINFAFGGNILFKKYIETSAKFKNFSFLTDFIEDEINNGSSKEEAIKNYIDGFGSFTYYIIVPVKSISESLLY